MFWNNPKWLDSSRKFLIDSHNYKDSVKILPVDFSKPWWHILLKQKKFIALFFVIVTINGSFITLLVFLLAYIINSGNYFYLLALVAARIALAFVATMINYYARILIVQTSASLQYRATNFFLTVDPVAHSTRSSGVVVSKTNRLGTASETFLDLTVFSGLDFLVNVFSAFAVILTISWQLGLINIVGFLLAGTFVIFCQTIRRKIFHKVMVRADDQKTSTQIENLQQVIYIRSLFATGIQDQKAKEHLLDAMNLRSVNQRVSRYIIFATNFIYMSFFAIFGWFLFQQIQSGQINPVLGLSIAGLYLGLNSNLQRVGNDFQRIGEVWDDLNDSFKFIRDFGVQSYPVLEDTCVDKIS